jgi:hypothetical protein
VVGKYEFTNQMTAQCGMVNEFGCNVRREREVISVDFSSPPSKTEVSRSRFPTQCYVGVHKAELCIWIIQVIARYL